jgi:hypothetical protein
MEQQQDTEHPDIQWPEWSERRRGERRTYKRRSSDQVRGDVMLRLLGSEYDALEELARKFGYEDATHFAEDLIRVLLSNPPSAVMECLGSLLAKPAK